LDYYKINEIYELERVHIGKYYDHDVTTYPNQLMDIILCDDLLFSNIANDILYCELYRQFCVILLDS